MARHRPGAKRSFQDIDLSWNFDEWTPRRLKFLWQNDRICCGDQVTESGGQRTGHTLDRLAPVCHLISVL
jgi:hypothetical protein